MPYEGFAKLKGELAAKGGIRNPGAVAASIGKKKYGAKKFQAAAAKGKKMKGMKPKKKGSVPPQFQKKAAPAAKVGMGGIASDLFQRE